MIDLVIETARLRLRPLEPGDLDIALDLFTDENVSRYVGGVVAADKIERNMPTWCQRCASGAIGVWCVIDKQSGEKLGTGALLPLPVDVDDTEWALVQGDDMPPRDIEIGYILKPSAWGHGIATEVCTALVDFGFRHTALDTIVATFDDDNVRSRQVLMKSGLRYTGSFRAYGEDTCPRFAIRRNEWSTAST